jgi:hypothetical protein
MGDFHPLTVSPFTVFFLSIDQPSTSFFKGNITPAHRFADSPVQSSLYLSAVSPFTVSTPVN